MSTAETAVNVFAAVISVSAVVVIVWELKLQFVDKRGYYRFADTSSNLFTMVLYTLLGSAAFGFIYVCYEWLRESVGMFVIEPSNAWAWVGGFVLTDCCHYWFHRGAHRNNFLWGIHQGHHTSEDFNLSTAVRKGIFQQWVDWPFFLPLAVLGFPFFEMYLPLKGLQFAYQFWLHNQFIGKLGPVERVMVTPSLHRVHHGQNPEYIDRNYAGVFIIWDKLFGSYAEEREPVRYGITTPVNSFNPLGYQFTWWGHLWRDAAATRSWWDKIRLWFMPVGWRPADRRSVPWPNKLEPGAPFEKFDVPVSVWTRVYAIVQLVLVAAALSLLTGQEFHPLSVPGDALVLVYAAWTSGCVGLYLNRSAAAFRVDLVRNLAVLGIWLAAHQQQTVPAEALIALLVGHLLGMLWQLAHPGSRSTPALARDTSPEPS